MQFKCRPVIGPAWRANANDLLARMRRLPIWIVITLITTSSIAARAAEPVAITPGFAATAPRVALVIGNAGYNGMDRLGSPSSDANLVAGTLRSIGFSVDIERDQTRAQMLDALDRFSKQASRASIALIYYAGHGFESGGENYLIPVDIPVSIDKVVQTDLRRYAVPLRYVRSTVNGGEPRSLVLLLDTCRSPAARGPVRHTMSTVDAAHGELIAFATQPGGAALDTFWLGATRYDHSPFAYYLSQQMASGGDLLTMLKHTQIMVSAATADTQRPWFNDGLIGDLQLTDPIAPGPRTSVSQATGTSGAARGASIQRAAPGDPEATGSDEGPAADTSALPAHWDSETGRMLKLVPEIWQNPDVANEVHDQAEQGDLFAMTTMAIALQNRPPGISDEIWFRMHAQATAYTVYATGRHYPLAEALYGNWLLRENPSVADQYTAALFLQRAVDDGYAKAIEKLVPLLPKVGRSNLVDQYNARYRQMYGRNLVLTNLD